MGIHEIATRADIERLEIMIQDIKGLLQSRQPPAESEFVDTRTAKEMLCIKHNDTFKKRCDKNGIKPILSGGKYLYRRADVRKAVEG